jgi:hypothetical protein
VPTVCLFTHLKPNLWCFPTARQWLIITLI